MKSAGEHAIPELLAPAGGFEQLEYAIHFGADAVYLACDKFGMRARANNFSLEELERAVHYAHEHNVKVHVTTNIVMKDAQIVDLPLYYEAFERIGVDAVILEDLGALRLAKKHAPHVDIHVSTQASVANVEAALMWYELGAKRIVLARELSLEEIKAMRRSLPQDLELEAFVHGSMCMSYSGRCLISDFLTGRSASQGNCAQSCRWNYALVEETRPGEFYPIEEDDHGSYLMSSTDMNMLAHLDDLREAGIDSFKIEGRNKKAFYVATVVHAYRKVLDGEPAKSYQHDLEATSHRPFHTGFYYGAAEQTPHRSGYLTSHVWVAEVIASVPFPSGEFGVEVRCRNHFEEGDKLELLSPNKPTLMIEIRNLEYIGGVPEVFDEELKGPICIANRAMEHYRFVCPIELQEMDILRLGTQESKIDSLS